MTDTHKRPVQISDMHTIELFDSLLNLVAGMGNERDKRSYTEFKQRILNEEELFDVYQSNWVAGKIIDAVPDDMTREWRSFTNLKPEQVEKIVNEEKRLKLRSSFNMAHKWSRLFGTSFILLGVNDGKKPSMPLDFEKLPKTGLRHGRSIASCV